MRSTQRARTVVEGPDKSLRLPRRFRDHGEVNGLRVRSHYDHPWGGWRFCLVDLARGVQLDGQYLSEDGARAAAEVRA